MMSNEITVTIDGKECKAAEGEYILNIARANDIFIPAICYLNDCSPTLACRICLVDIDGKNAYGCNAKAKDGMVVTTNSEEIALERKAIMQVYDVNHPLQCGVCDQSGECELQNYTLYENVNEQAYAITDTPRPIKDWDRIHYDAGLCIVCERCVTVCKDMIGTAALKTVPRGGEALSKELKDEMPKDAYAMWNKLQKSVIGTSDGAETLNCTQCGECIAVCPVGALVSSDFQYKTNAWELRKIPAANPHSSDCALIYYDVKQRSVDDPREKVYRVTNDFHYQALNGSARFGFDFENRVAGRDKAAFGMAVDALKQADTIAFNSYITNEEAMILQKLKEKLGLKLVNGDAYKYRKFLDAYSSVSGKRLYSGSLKGIKEGNFTAVIGSNVTHDNPNTSYAINNSVTVNKGGVLYFHPLQNKLVEGYGRTIMPFVTKPGEEMKSLALMFALFVEGRPDDAKDILDTYGSKEDLLEALGADDKFEAAFTKATKSRAQSTLVLGEDVIDHPEAANIAKLAAIFERESGFEILIIPTSTNTLGVSLICDLDESAGSQVVGYNEAGSFTLSSYGDGNLDMPALNQQEGTFTSIDKRVVPTNAAVDYYGYTLNEVACEVGVCAHLTIDYTKALPTSSGYQPMEFDLLPNFFDNGGNELRGYLLENVTCAQHEATFDQCACVDAESNVYLANPIDHFNKATAACAALKTDAGIYVAAGSEFAKSGEVEVEGTRLKVAVDRFIDGDMVYIPTYDGRFDKNTIYSGSRFAKVNIRGV
jgi:NADH-quinone oxidoreductase subunit G